MVFNVTFNNISV